MIGPIQRWIHRSCVLAFECGRPAAQAGQQGRGPEPLGRGAGTSLRPVAAAAEGAAGITTHDSRAPASSSPWTETTWTLG